jgi:hypothetical protein
VKQHLSILLALAVLLQCCSKTWQWMGFELNRDYIARTLCVNRDSPETMCRGLCYFKHQVQADTQQEQKEVPVAVFKLQYEVAYDLPEAFFWVTAEPSGPAPRPDLPFDRALHSRLWPGGVFQPPELTL